MSETREVGTLTAGALVRRHVRAMLDREGVAWTEHKGWTESTFVVRGTRRQIRSIRRTLARVAE